MILLGVALDSTRFGGLNCPKVL